MVITTVPLKMIRPLSYTENIAPTEPGFYLGLITPGGFRFKARLTNGFIAELKTLIEDYEYRGYSVDGIKVYPL